MDAEDLSIPVLIFIFLLFIGYCFYINARTSECSERGGTLVEVAFDYICVKELK